MGIFDQPLPTAARYSAGVGRDQADAGSTILPRALIPPTQATAPLLRVRIPMLKTVFSLWNHVSHDDGGIPEIPVFARPPGNSATLNA